METKTLEQVRTDQTSAQAGKALERMAERRNRLPRLTQHLRHLAYTMPISRAAHEKNSLMQSRPGLMDSINIEYLMVAVLDYVLERMGLDVGATLEEMLAHVADLVRDMDPRKTRDERDLIANLVFDELTNRRGNFGEFNVTYFDADRGFEDFFSFRLLRNYEGSDGQIRYKLTDEGIVLHLGMLDKDPATQQQTQELVITTLIQRRRFDVAVNEISATKAASIRFKEMIEVELSEAERQIEYVTWSDDLEPVLTEARQHLTETMDRELAIVREIDAAETSVEIDESRVKLNRVRQAMTECWYRHENLLDRISRAAPRFLELQQRAFFMSTRRRLPDLESEILAPLMQIPMAEWGDRSQRIVALLSGPGPHPILHFKQAVDILLTERSDDDVEDETEEEEVTKEDPAAALVKAFDDRLLADATRYARARIAEGTQRMHAILAAANADGKDEAFQRCLFFVLEQAIENTNSPLQTRAQIMDVRFQADFVAGDDVHYQPKRSDQSDAPADTEAPFTENDTDDD